MEDEVEVEAEVVAFKQGEVVAFNVAEVHPGVEVVGVAVAASGVEGDFRTRFCNIFSILLFYCHFWVHRPYNNDKFVLISVFDFCLLME